MNHTVLNAIASAFIARKNCFDSPESQRHPWYEKHRETIESLVENQLPHRSGFDGGCSFDWNKSRRNRLVFNTSFHHMNENGMYDCWTDHSIIVTPDLVFGYSMRITGPNHNDIKEYIRQTFTDSLDQDCQK